MQDKQYRAEVKAFFTSLTLGLILIAIGFILGKGTYYQGTDFNLQQVAFSKAAADAIFRRDILWSDIFDLGTSFIGAYSFYNIGSPFFWRTLPFYKLGINYSIILPFMLAVKFGVAGLSSFCYIRQYTKGEKWALVASMLYAFSSYQIANINYHFHDVTALFPFLLLALDRAVKEEKKGWFAFWVAILAITNYFFFVSIVVFLVIYFAVKLISKEYTLDVKLFISLAVESLLGVGMAAFLFLPSMLFVLGNPRSTDLIFSLPIRNWFILKPYEYGQLIHAFIMPAESIFERSMFISSLPTAADCYIPLFGIIPVVSFVYSNKKNWISKLIIVLTIFMLMPILNNSFTAFNAEYYPRWYFMAILVICVATAIQLENGVEFKAGFIFNILLWVGLFVFYVIWKYYYESVFFINIKTAVLLILIGLFGILRSFFVIKYRHNARMFTFSLVAIYISVSISFGLNTYHNQRYWNKNYPLLSAKDFYALTEDIYTDNTDYYRIDNIDLWSNTGIYTNKPSTVTFSSNISSSIYDFYIDNGYSRTVNSRLPADATNFKAILGVKYLMSKSESNEKYPGFEKEPEYSCDGIYFYKNLFYTGMGCAYKNAIAYDDYVMQDANHKQLTMLDAVVLTEQQIEKYDDIINIISAKDSANMTEEVYADALSFRSESAPKNFSYKNAVYSFDVSIPENTLYFVSVPYDRGFTAYVDGEKVEIEKVNLAFIGLCLEKGEHYVELKYLPVGLIPGTAITALSVFAFLSYTMINKRKNNVKNKA